MATLKTTLPLELKTAPPAWASKDTAGSKKAQRQERAAARASLTELRKSVRNFEKEMERSNTKLKAIEEILADQKTYDEMPADELNDLSGKSSKFAQAGG